MAIPRPAAPFGLPDGACSDSQEAMVHDLILHDKHTDKPGLEDLLSAAALDAIADAPTAIRDAFFRDVAHVHLGPDPEIRFELWPSLESGRPWPSRVEPDALAVGPLGCLVTEAKANDQFSEEQLVAEGIAAGLLVDGRVPVYLLTIGLSPDPDFLRSPSFIDRGVYEHTAHTSWSRLASYLASWSDTPGLEPGPQRLMRQASRVVSDLLLGKHTPRKVRG